MLESKSDSGDPKKSNEKKSELNKCVEQKNGESMLTLPINRHHEIR